MASLAITNNPDIRFLGRLLGDVIRAYGGEELFKRIEYIRSTSVDRARGVAGAGAVDRGLDRAYASAAREEPPARLDAAILAAAHREAGARPRALGSMLRAWKSDSVASTW